MVSCAFQVLSGKLEIQGGVYDLKTGRVELPGSKKDDRVVESEHLLVLSKRISRRLEFPDFLRFGFCFEFLVACQVLGSKPYAIEGGQVRKQRSTIIA